MKTLHKILKISAKESFKNLRNKSPIFCPALDSDIQISRVFWEHINWEKERPLYDKVQRLAFFPLIEKIIQKGILIETRKKHFTIVYSESTISFIVILEKIPTGILLLSCFVDTKKKGSVLPHWELRRKAFRAFFLQQF